MVYEIKKKFGDKIIVEWNDAYAEDEWIPFDKAIKISDKGYCKTIGFYIGQKGGYLIVASTIGKTKKEDLGGIWYIPLKWLIKVK